LIEHIQTVDGATVRERAAIQQLERNQLETKTARELLVQLVVSGNVDGDVAIEVVDAGELRSTRRDRRQIRGHDPLDPPRIGG
jgi:hypothetical protein